MYDVKDKRYIDLIDVSLLSYVVAICEWLDEHSSPLTLGTTLPLSCVGCGGGVQ
jgi:hypothetical protein